MSKKKGWRIFPGFRATCLIICVLYVVIPLSLFLPGIEESMSRYGIPPEVLHSPHYVDAILWVYSHMMVIGVMVGLLGLYAESNRLKINMSRALLVAHVYYTFLDFRASDSLLGNGLYKGPHSVVPAVIALMVTILFVNLSFNMSLYNGNRDGKRVEVEAE